jgi:PPP family 3-phenylpropionic acid transporter
MIAKKPPPDSIGGGNRLSEKIMRHKKGPNGSVFCMQIGFATRLAALYGAMFILLGIQLPFFPVWLKAKGLDAGMIGVVLAAPIVVRVFSITLAARVADRRDALRAAIVVTSAASVLGYTLVGLAAGPMAILAAYAAAALVFTPVMPLADTYALKGLRERGRAYGPVRLWGSAAFILGSFVAGVATDTIPARHLIWLIVAASLVSALVATSLAPLAMTAPPAGETCIARGGLLRDRAFITGLAAASLIQASHAVYYSFSALQWRADGLDGTNIAGLWALGVIAEIVLFALQGRLPPFVSPTVLLIAGGLGGALRWGAMALAPPAALLPVLQLLHALSFGATHLGALGFVASKAPAGQGATAQGYLAVVLGITMAVSTGISGLLYGRFGSLAYAAMALTAIAGGIAGYVAHRSLRDGALRDGAV